MTARRPAEAFPPGEFLREELEERGWSQQDLATILGCNVRTVNEIVTGKRGVTPEAANGLSAALGTSPEFWLNLDQAYKLWRMRDKDNSPILSRAELFSVAPVTDMVKRGWLDSSENVEILRKSMLSFFGVSDLSEQALSGTGLFRKSGPANDQTPAQRAWLFRARNLARAVHAAPFSSKNGSGLVDAILKLSHTPQEVRHVPKALSKFGVRLVIVQPLPSSKVDGAFFRLDSDSPVIALSLRYDRIDSFWFTLMHECAHCILGHDESIDIDLDNSKVNSDRQECELEADLFALGALIDQAALSNFIARKRPLYSARNIVAFAQTINVHPGIVVGQLQHRGEVSWANFRKMLVPVREYITPVALTDGWGSAAPCQT